MSYKSKTINMKKFSLLFVVAIVVSLALSSCSKYDEGPTLTLRSKASRLNGEWKITKVTENGVARSFDANARVTMDKDGGYKYTTSYLGQSVTGEGTWKLSSDSEKITFTSTYGQYTDSEEYVIKRLSSKELFLEQRDADDNDLDRIEYEKI